FAQTIGLDERFVKGQYDKRLWSQMRDAIAAKLIARTRDEWARVFEHGDSCVAPVLTLREAPSHAHALARSAFVEVAGVMQAAPAPRFSRSRADTPRATRPAGSEGEMVLVEAGFSEAEVQALRAAGVLRDPSTEAR
ncbi:MAG: CoA transferase, partial [Burkholderiales bacterium]